MNNQQVTGVGPLAYIGGKNRIASKIIALFPEHQTYVEPFAGGAQVFFHKEPSKAEVLNDLDGDVVNFFRVCQLHHEEFLRYVKFILVSRQWFDLLKAQPPESLTDIQRAARFYYLMKNAYAGLVRAPRYVHSVQSPRSFNPLRIPEVIDRVHRRLARVQIEHLPYEKILETFDGPATLFYCDPPYYGLKLYRHNLGAADFEKLEERLRSIKGKFVLSLNDRKEVRDLFGKFYIREITLAYTAQKEAGKRYQELLIANFELPEVKESE